MSVSSFYEDLSQKIILNPQFITDFEELTRLNFIGNKTKSEFNIQKRLIESAAIFACSDNEKHKRIALKIAGIILENSESNELIRAASELIFLRLGNFPILEMSFSDPYDYKDYFNIFSGEELENLPVTLGIEVTKKVISNSFTIKDRTIYLTDFQTAVFNSLRNKRNVSISAPTSAGKSFVLERYVVDHFLNKQKSTIIYIVPTRALIAQIQNDFRKIFDKFSIRDVDILTSSWEIIGEGKRELSRAVLILTQERLQAIEGKIDYPLSIDLLIVDEAHKIEEEARGIWLEESIQQIIDWNPNLQIVFISPFTINPEKFGKIFFTENLQRIYTRLPPVHQNLIFVDIENRKIKLWQGSQELKRRFELDEHEVQENIPTSIYARKAWVAKNILVESESIMIYCNGPSDCRKTAKAYSEVKNTKVENSKITEFINFLKINIHPQYYLIDYLKRGVGYHYSDMPSSVKSAVESLFSQKILGTMCCTSTLLEGVNFPAKSIVIYKPRKGMPMDELTFWNLAGRAGRLMKDFSGNIYCVDIDSWAEEGYKPELEDGGHTIQSSMENVISGKRDKIVGHLKNYNKQEEDDVKAAVTRFLINEIAKGSDEFVEQLIKRNTEISKENLDEIVVHLTKISSKIGLHKDVITRNRSIDPRLQNNLYNFLKNSNSLAIPVHPSKYSDFYNNLLKIMEIINKCFKRGYHQNSLTYYAWLSSRWSNEKTLGEIIRERINYLQSQGKMVDDQESINKTIEEIIRDINQKLTFEICRDLSCYIDILKFVAQERGIDVSKSDEKVPYYIEVGASKPTTLTLMNNGIPRTVAILISRMLPSDIQDFDKLKKYIMNNEESLKRQVPSILFDDLFK
ncbi:MAG: DEAD/DEAH box helicase [Methanomicrobia archaeon]|nr:DEAD/DEAH box helicase [Methanomicrobia archaeon]